MSYSLDQHKRVDESITYPKTGVAIYSREDKLRYYVSDEPVIEENSYGSMRKVYFLPDVAIATFDSDYIDHVVVRGDLIKKDGTPGQRRPSRIWHLSSIDEAPEWVRELMKDAAKYLEVS